jgi:predicted PurR-regulated permease PerM
MATSGTGRKTGEAGSPESERRGWPTRDILRTLAIIAGFYITIQLLWVGQSIVLLTFLGVLFGIALTAGVDWLERRRVPRGVGAVLILLTFLGILAGIGAATAPSITGQLRELRTQLPEAIGQIQRWVRDRQEGVTQVLEEVDAAPEGDKQGAQDTAGSKVEQGGEKEPSIGQSVAEQVGGVTKHAFGFFSSTLAALGGPRPTRPDSCISFLMKPGRERVRC